MRCPRGCSFPPYRHPQILTLPCRHNYHETCVTQWLRYKGINATCPLCKDQVFTPPAGSAPLATL